MRVRSTLSTARAIAVRRRTRLPIAQVRSLRWISLRASARRRRAAQPMSLARIVGPASRATRISSSSGVAALGQHDAHGRSRSPAPSLAGKALALEPERAARAGAGRDRKLDRAVERRHPHLAAEHRLVERDRKFEPQVVPSRSNSGCGATVTVISASPARPPGTRQPLPLQPDLLAVGETRRNLDVDLLAGRQLHALRRAAWRPPAA